MQLPPNLTSHRAPGQDGAQEEEEDAREEEEEEATREEAEAEDEEEGESQENSVDIEVAHSPGFKERPGKPARSGWRAGFQGLGRGARVILPGRRCRLPSLSPSVDQVGRQGARVQHPCLRGSSAVGEKEQALW